MSFALVNGELIDPARYDDHILEDGDEIVFSLAMASGG